MTAALNRAILLFLAGLLLGLAVSYGIFGSAVADREASLREWRSIARDEREAALEARKLGREEMLAWRAATEEARQEQTRLMGLLRDYELSLAGSSRLAVWAGLAVFALCLFLAWRLASDANRRPDTPSGHFLSSPERESEIAFAPIKERLIFSEADSPKDGFPEEE